MTGWRAPPSLMADSPVPKMNDANRAEGEEGNKGAGVLSYDMLARKALEKAGRAGKMFSELHKKSSTRKGNILAASRLKRDSDSTGTDSLETTGMGQAFQEKENLSPAAAGDQQSPTRVETPTTPNSSSTLVERTPLTETPEATGSMGEVRDGLNDSLFEAMSACSLKTPKVVGLRLPTLQDDASDFNTEAPTSAADPNISTPSSTETSPRSAANTSLPISTNTSKAEDVSPVPTSLPSSVSGISDLSLSSATKQVLSSVSSDKSPTSSPPQSAPRQVLSSVSSDMSLVFSPPPPPCPAKQVFSSVSSDMSLIFSPLPFDKSPLPDLAPEDEDLAWLEDQRTTSSGEGRGKLVTDLAQLLKRSSPTSDFPLIKEPDLPSEPKQTKTPEQNTSTTTRNATAVTSKLPRFSPNNPEKVEHRQSSGTAGSKRLVKFATAAQSPLCNDPSATRKVAQPINEGKGKADSPLLSSTVLSPRRSKMARPHQGVPFNVKPAPSPSKSAGGKMAREPVSNHSPSSPIRATTTPPAGSSTHPRSSFTSNAGSSTTPRRHKLLPLKPLNVLDTTVDPSSTTTLDSPLKAVKFTEVHKISKKSAPVHSNSPNESSVIAKKTLPSQFNNSSSLQNSPTSHENSPSSLRNISSMNRQLGKSASSSRLPLPVSMAVKKA